MVIGSAERVDTPALSPPMWAGTNGEGRSEGGERVQILTGEV